MVLPPELVVPFGCCAAVLFCSSLKDRRSRRRWCRLHGWQVTSATLVCSFLSCCVCDSLSSFSLLPFFVCVCMCACVRFDLIVCLFPVFYHDWTLTEIWNSPPRPPIPYWWRVLVTRSKGPVVNYRNRIGYINTNVPPIHCFSSTLFYL